LYKEITKNAFEVFLKNPLTNKDLDRILIVEMGDGAISALAG